MGDCGRASRGRCTVKRSHQVLLFNCVSGLMRMSCLWGLMRMGCLWGLMRMGCLWGLMRMGCLWGLMRMGCLWGLMRMGCLWGQMRMGYLWGLHAAQHHYGGAAAGLEVGQRKGTWEGRGVTRGTVGGCRGCKGYAWLGMPLLLYGDLACTLQWQRVRHADTACGASVPVVPHLHAPQCEYAPASPPARLTRPHAFQSALT